MEGELEEFTHFLLFPGISRASPHRVCLGSKCPNGAAKGFSLVSPSLCFYLWISHANPWGRTGMGPDWNRHSFLAQRLAEDEKLSISIWDKREERRWETDKGVGQKAPSRCPKCQMAMTMVWRRLLFRPESSLVPGEHVTPPPNTDSKATSKDTSQTAQHLACSLLGD